jgi:hypothetical protein
MEVNMQEIPFSIPLSGVIHVGDNVITVSVNKAETTVHLGAETVKQERISLPKGRTIFDLVLEAARDVTEEKGVNRFSAAELYHKALEKYPNLKRNSWTSHVIACAPGHPSHKYYTSRRDYFSYMGDGQYRLSAHFNLPDTSD